MALPKITNNSPVAGSIAWTATNLTFGTTNFSVPAGSSSKKFVWWEYRGGAPALVDGDVLPELKAEDMLLFLNKNGVGALVPMTDVVDGSLIVSGSVMAAAIAADQIQTYHIKADAVTASEIAAGAVAAEHIAAGTITTDKLAVGSVGDNLVTNGSFEEFANGMPIGWRAIATANGGAIDVVTGVASSGTNAARLIATGTTSNARMEQTPDRFIPVSSASGRKWYISARMGAGTAISSGAWLRANWYDGNKALVSSADVLSNGSITTSFTVYEGQVTPPSNAKYMSLAVFLYNPSNATNLYVDEIIAREVVISAQIGDGQITTAKILAGNVTTDRLAAKAVTADKMVISDSSNIWPNPFLDASLSTWNVGAAYAGAEVSPRGTARLLNSRDHISGGTIPARPGDTYVIDVSVKRIAGTAPMGAGTWLRTVSGANVASSPWRYTNAYDVVETLANGWERRRYAITIPSANTDCAGFGLYFQLEQAASGGATSWLVADVTLRRMGGGELIVDGAIIADHLATNAVTADKIAADAVTANKILAGSIGTNHMVANSINADRLVANSVTVDKLSANSVAADKIAANAVTASKLESELVLATKIIAGNPSSTHAEMSNQGFRVFADDPSDGIPNEVVRLGVASTDDYFAVTKADGSLAASISQAGVGSFEELNTNELHYKGESLSDLLWNLPRGHIGSAFRTNHSVYNAVEGGGVQPYLRFDCELEEGRLYKISTSTIRMGITAGGIARTYLQSAINEVATTSHWIITHEDQNAEGMATQLNELWTPKVTGFVKGQKIASSFLLSFIAVKGACGIRADANAPVRLLVEDVGPLVNTTNGVHLDGTNQAPPPPSEVTYVRQYGCRDSMNYQGNNAQYNWDVGRMYQGLSPAGYGNLKSIALFPDMTPDLSGARINYIRVYFNFAHWYYNSGGTARIGAHPHMGIPGSFSQIGIMTESGGWPKPGARWVDLPSNTFEGFKTGAYRGITLEGDGTYGTYGYADRPTIEISYTK